MGSFNEELTAARKAKGMTQEQLAEAMNASRSAVSHWESGRSAPDYATINQLSVVLDCTFSVQQKDAGAGMPSESETQPKAERIIAAAVLAAAVILAVCLLITGTGSAPAAEAPAVSADALLNPVLPPKANTVEWFSVAEVPQSGKPFVMVQFNENPMYAVHDEGFTGGEGWYYTVYFTETNGYPLNMKQIEVVVFNGTDRPDVFTYNASEFTDWFGSNVLAAKGQYAFAGGFPLQNEVGVGVALTGTDESGEEFTFHAYLPLLHEFRE